MKNEKWLLVLLAAVQFTHILDFVIMMPLGPQLMPALGIGTQQFGVVISAYTFSAGASGLAAAFFLDRFNRRRALLALYLGFALGTLACAGAPTYAWLVAARVLTGAFGGVLGSLVLAIVGDAVPEQRRGQAIGVVMSGLSVASVVGVPLGLLLASRYSWHLPFLVLGGLSLLLWPLMYRVMPDMRDHLTGAAHSFRERVAAVAGLFAEAPLRAALGLTALLILGHFGVVSFLSPALVGNVGLTAGQLSYVYLAGGALTFFTSPLVGRLADRYGKVRVFTWLNLAALPALVLITRLGVTPLLPALGLTTLLFGVLTGRNITATALITTVVRPAQRGAFLSLNTAVQQLAAGAAAYGAGLLVTSTASGTLLHFEGVGYLAAATTILSFFVVRRIVAAPHQDAPGLVSEPVSDPTTRLRVEPLAP